MNGANYVTHEKDVPSPDDIEFPSKKALYEDLYCTECESITSVTQDGVMYICDECNCLVNIPNDYTCKVCGADFEGSPVSYGDFSCDPGTLVWMSKPRENARYSYEFGVRGWDWTEIHKCHICAAYYQFKNGNV